MKAGKIGLLFLILAFGSTVETAWRVRNHLGLKGPWGWRVLGGKFYGPSFAFNADQTQVVTAGTPVEIENAFGTVKVAAGAAGEVRVSLRKVVFQPTEEKARAFADRVQLRAGREGGALRIGTNRADLEQASGLDSEVGFETNLEVVVPPGTPVKVANEHGAVQVADVARAEVTSSFDEVRVERVAGEAAVDVRHGDVKVAGVKGDLKLTDRHGDVSVEDVGGHAVLDAQHGDVTAARVGSLVLHSAHGDVSVDTVRGDLEVHAQHGQVRARDVSGRASIETSFQGITLDKVGGDATLHTEHGDISVTDAAGAVDAQASFDDVSLVRVVGPVTVVVSHGAVRAQGLEKGARVRASGDDVVLDGFRGAVEVDAERASVRLVASAPVTEAVRVNVAQGGIEMEVPAGSRFDLQASADGGEVSADAPGLSVTQTSPGRLNARMGAGGNAVVLTARHGDVRLRTGAAVASKTP